MRENRSSMLVAGEFTARCMMGSLFVIEGVSKLNGFAAATAYMERAGLPGQLLPAVIAFEILAGLMLALGWQTRIVAFLLSAFCVAAAVLFHSKLGVRIEQIQFEKNIALAGGLLFVALRSGYGARPHDD